MTKTLDQLRADYALQKIRRWLDESGKVIQTKHAEEYARFVRRAPSMVLTNGLLQTLAFLLAKAGDEAQASSQQLYKDLSDWLLGPKTEERPERVYTDGSEKELIRAIMKGTRAHYIQARIAALGLLTWMAKFAEAFLPKGKNR